MEEAKSTHGTARGLLISILYCAAFLASWRLSVDQWYLPAGLRAAALLFLPYRYWPYAFAGDSAALLVLRGPKAAQYGDEWAYLSPFLLMPMVALVPAVLRSAFGDMRSHVRWFPAIALTLAIWGAICNMTLNAVLSGPVADNTLEKFIRFIVGHYLGIFMLALPIMAWLRHREYGKKGRHLVNQTAIAAGALGVFYIAVFGVSEPVLRQLLMLLMIAPAVALTFAHGWRGAALGIALVSTVMGLTMADQQIVGAHDPVTFLAQEAFAVIATALFVLGATISEHYERARRLGIAEQHALTLAKSSFLSSERHMRDRVIAMAQLEAQREEWRKDLVQRLKESGHFAAAMDLMRVGALDARMFDDHASALYPMRIEERGLYDVLQSSAFAGIWGGGADMRCLLRGRVRLLNVDLQVAAYRSICNAVALLSASRPEIISVRARVWRSRHWHGLVVSITAPPASSTQRTPMSAMAWLELEARIKTHGGTLRRRRGNRVSFLLTETPVTDAVRQSAGVMDHTSPLGPT